MRQEQLIHETLKKIATRCPDSQITPFVNIIPHFQGILTLNAQALSLVFFLRPYGLNIVIDERNVISLAVHSSLPSPTR